MSALKERMLGLVFRILIRSIDLLASRYGLSKEECDNFYRLAHAQITLRELWESFDSSPQEKLPLIDVDDDKGVKKPPKFRRTYSGVE
jgi:hypothetical protein